MCQKNKPKLERLDLKLKNNLKNASLGPLLQVRPLDYFSSVQRSMNEQIWAERTGLKLRDVKERIEDKEISKAKGKMSPFPKQIQYSSVNVRYLIIVE